ncbi:hypothetical protein [Nonomuraea sp. NPDC048916]|uniref:hypothetical protein n=1 Tax=Nonomuraea sp. NPDC048916 TaxID=3154232 RepID=UPI0033EA2386
MGDLRTCPGAVEVNATMRPGRVRTGWRAIGTTGPATTGVADPGPGIWAAGPDVSTGAVGPVAVIEVTS